MWWRSPQFWYTGVEIRKGAEELAPRELRWGWGCDGNKLLFSPSVLEIEHRAFALG